jgi:hypothetical protein
MITFPRTPSEGKLPLFGALRAFEPKGSGACAPRPVDFAVIFAKSLMLERNLPTDWGVFSTGCAAASTCCAVLSTSAFFRFSRPVSIYLSLYKKKERRKEGLEGKATIHGFEQLPKKASTGFTPIPPLTRGNTWMQLFCRVNGLSGDIGGIHASTGCFAGGYFGIGHRRSA